MEQNRYPLKRNGYIYSKGTAEGFLRMKRQGFPRPLFSIENKLQKTLLKTYGKLLKQLMADFKGAAKAAGIAPDNLTTDSPEDDSFKSLMDFFDAMAEIEKSSIEAMENAELKAKLESVSQSLKNKWYRDADEEGINDDLDHEMADIFQECQTDFLKKLMSDADLTTSNIISTFSIDKQQLYNDNMREIRRLYLDNARVRIIGEQDILKKMFLQALDDYITGRTSTLNIKTATDGLLARSKNMSQFFARDQMARLNKATTLATFKAAGITKFKWITCHDVRVRASHKKLDGQIFDIDSPPPELSDYNCRCGIVPYRV